MRCSEFLLRYSDFRDETIADQQVRWRFIVHLSDCPRCARYHEVITKGVDFLRSCDQIEPSPSFRPSLARRLAAAVLHPDPHFAVPVRLVGSLILAASVAVLVVEGVTQDTREVAPRQHERPMPMVQAHPRPPFVTFGDLEAPGAFVTPAWTTDDYAQRASQAFVTLTSLVDPE